jgi:anthranilate synthase component 1
MDFTEFSNKAKDGFNLIPLIKELDSIKKEAIDIYGDHFDQKKSFFFESLEGDKNWSRYTIIGCSSGDYLEVFGNKIRKYSNFLEESEYHDDNPINWIENFFSSYKVFIPKTLPSFCGGLVGHFSFESVCYFEESVIRRDQKNDINAPDISLIICKEFIVFDKVNNKIFIVVFSNNTLEGYKESTKKLNEYELLLNKSSDKTKDVNVSYEMNLKYDFERKDFLSSVNKIKEYINQGDVMQVVLSQRMTIDFHERPIEFYKELRKINPSPYMYYLNMGDYVVVGSSPEILVRLEDENITVRPIAGTRPRSNDNKKDKDYEIDLLNDKKELAEHLMLIDLGRNDIGRICKTGSINLTDQMIIEKYSHVMHMVSNVEGQIKPNLSMFDVLRATFPAGTVSGAPKIRALQIIFELENISRGIYAGAIGYLGWNGNMDTAIAIRTCVIKSEKLHIQCGAGIVYDSVPELEWDETINKGKAIIKALEKLRERI